MTRRQRRIGLIGANLVALGALAAVGGWDVLQVYTGIALPERQGPPMQLVAHRGDLDHWPENTLEGLTAAAALPLDGIELDTVQSADGSWWVIHDPSLDRTTDANGWIPRLSDEQIEAARIDGGIGFDRSVHGDQLAIPRLSAVLDALSQYQGRLYVDVQHAPSGDVAEIVELLDGRPAAILCRNLDDARTVKDLDPGLSTYLRPEDGPADANVDGWLMESFLEADVGAVRQSRLPVITFIDQWRAGQDEAPLIRRAWAIGVHAFLTKNPSAAIEARTDLARDTGHR